MDVVELGSYRQDAPLEVALGFFDGLHLGHQRIVARAVEIARERARRAALFTFRHHPMRILRPAQAQPLLTTFEEKVDLLAETGIDDIIWLEFTTDFSQLSPEEFARDFLLARLHARGVVAGFNYRFGHGARGDVQTLTHLGHRLGFDTDVVSGLDVDGQMVSSTRLRALVADGDVVGAGRLLGRPYSAVTEAVHGRGRGRTIGFPTANLSVPPDKLLPADGVYAARVRVGGTLHDAVANIGVRPTFGQSRRVLEVHVLDFTGDLYGRQIEIAFVDRLRGERKFDSVNALVAQISRDVDRARQLLTPTLPI